MKTQPELNIDKPKKLKSAAYLVYSEWGPQLSIPRNQRLAQEFPQISAIQRAAW